MFSYTLNHLRELEAESIEVLREVAEQFRNPVLLFSGGKDSVVASWLARKAFYPAAVRFPLLHIDTGHNFPETLHFRDAWVKENGFELLVRTVQASIDSGRVKEEGGFGASRNRLQSVTLMDALHELNVDAAIGGARRDEEKARAKERFFSKRTPDGSWNPAAQQPEMWNLYNGRCREGEHFRIFPLSNWTELDIWNYIQLENLPVPELYFAHEREVFERNGNLCPVSDFVRPGSTDTPMIKRVRFRTVGDMTCTGAVESEAGDIDAIICELEHSSLTERGTRIDDQFNETAMEDRKREGYF